MQPEDRELVSSRKPWDLFDEIAATYDRVRPQYPEQLIDDVIRYSGISEEGRMLEIGCGTGKATELFAQRGFSIHCLEPGAAMIDILTRNCRAYQHVRVEKTSFEDWEVQEGKFDLVVSAHAFHWLSPEIKFSKSARALNGTGSLAAFWNVRPEPLTEVSRAINMVYRRIAPGLADLGKRKPCDSVIESRGDEFLSSRQFKKPVVKRYSWSAKYSSTEYLDLLRTYTDHQTLPETTKSNLLDGIADEIEKLGGQVEIPYTSALFVAEKW